MVTAPNFDPYTYDILDTTDVDYTTQDATVRAAYDAAIAPYQVPGSGNNPDNYKYALQLWTRYTEWENDVYHANMTDEDFARLDLFEGNRYHV